MPSRIFRMEMIPEAKKILHFSYELFHFQKSDVNGGVLIAVKSDLNPKHGEIEVPIDGVDMLMVHLKDRKMALVGVYVNLRSRPKRAAAYRDVTELIKENIKRMEEIIMYGDFNNHANYMEDSSTNYTRLTVMHRCNHCILIDY